VFGVFRGLHVLKAGPGNAVKRAKIFIFPAVLAQIPRKLLQTSVLSVFQAARPAGVDQHLKSRTSESPSNPVALSQTQSNPVKPV
jgi:hypothetical protein